MILGLNTGWRVAGALLLCACLTIGFGYQGRAGGLLREVYTGIGGSYLDDLLASEAFPDHPTRTEIISEFETPIDEADDYGQRVRGFLVPPVTGDYVFWVSSDDESVLYLSSDSSPDRRVDIASVPGWTTSRQWDKFPSQQSGAIWLEASKVYYVEALMKEGGGGDNLAVRWQMPGGSIEEPIPEARLLPFGTVFAPPTITEGPVDATVQEGQPAQFAVRISNPDPALYQWWRDGRLISGATNPTYTLAPVALSDSGARFWCALANALGTNQTRQALLSVDPDKTAPTLAGAYNLGANTLELWFSEPIETTSGRNARNYQLDGGISVRSAAVAADGRSVRLDVSDLAMGRRYTLTVNQVRDRALTPNTIAPDSTIQFDAARFAPADIGDPEHPGSIVVAQDGLDLTASGAGIGAHKDQLQFAYQERVGDFDVALRLTSIDAADVWAAAGLMARQNFAENSPFAATLATPTIGGAYFAARVSTNASTIAGSAPVNYPHTWLRLKRAGNVFTGFAGFDGQSWMQVGSVTNPMPPSLYLGLAVSSKHPDSPARAQFRDIGDVVSALEMAKSPDIEPLGPSSRRTGLVVSEIMYHPAARLDGKDLEFVELFNSQPTSEAIGGYRLAGDIEFTFPPDALIAAGGMILVARNPGHLVDTDVSCPVFGPYQGELTDGRGTLRMLNRLGAVLLEVEYSDSPPWPVAADGAGHSLVLARPSYGESDVRAWDASHAKGGSPGRSNPFHQSRIDSVKINELLAHTDEPVLDFVELYNHGSTEVDLSGAWLSDTADTLKYAFPPGTRLSPGGFVALTQNDLGFALSASGETVYLVSADQTHVVDAVRYGPQANGVAFGRYPDGAPHLHALRATTPGKANAPLDIPQVVINEIMFNPLVGGDDAEFVELHNRSSSSIDVTNWRFVDGIDFVFPSGTVIPGGGYIVLARNRSWMTAHYPALAPSNLLGDFQGQLSNQGERLTLARPSDPALPDIDWVTVDEVTYGEGGSWGRWADGGGSSLELIDPRCDNRLAANWADSDESAKAPWGLVEFTGELDLGTSQFGVDRLQVMLMGPGECLIDGVEVIGPSAGNLVKNSGFEQDAEGWKGLGTHIGSALEPTQGYQSRQSYRLRAGGRGSTDANHVFVDLLGALSPGQRATLRARVRWLRGDPELLLRLRGNYLEVAGVMPLPTGPGTPGARNSRLNTNVGPAVWDVRHYPVLPEFNRAVRVTARAHDADGIGSLKLRYRVDPLAQEYTLAMADDGLGADEIVGDGVFSATIPGQPSTNLVRFYIEAADAASPRASRLYPPDAPSQECLVRWGEPIVTGNLGTYRIWITRATIEEWAGREPSSNLPLPATFVYGHSRVVHQVGALYSGSPFHWTSYDSPLGRFCNYVLVFPEDERFLGSTDFVLNLPANLGSDKTSQREQLFYSIAEQVGRPYTYRRFCHVYLNGVRRGSIFEDAQQPNREFVEQWFPDDANGQLFKIEDWFDYEDGYQGFENVDATLEDFKTTDGVKKLARYRWNWRKRARQDSAHDYQEIFALVDALNTPHADLYTSEVQALVDVDDWMRAFALRHVAGDWDSYGYRRGKNMYAYKPERGRWRMLDWDVAFAFGLGDGAQQDVFDVRHSDGTIDPVTQRMYQHPPFRRAYLRAIYDTVNGPMTKERCAQVLNARHSALFSNQLQPSSPNTVLSWIESRRNYLLNILETNDAPFALTWPSSGRADLGTNNLLTLQGTAPLSVNTLRVMNVAYQVAWSTVTSWQTKVPVPRGTNILIVQGYDTAGQPVPDATATVQVVSRGPPRQPRDHIVINEIMYHPAQPDTGFVEIHNTAPDFAFDLTGYRLRGTDFEFTEGTVIAPGAYLLVVSNRRAFSSHFGLGLPVAGEFAGRLRNDGETLTLVSPGLAPDAGQVINQVSYSDALPWPSDADGRGASLQLIDAYQDNRRPGNWTAVLVDAPTSPVWRAVSVTGIANSTSLFLFLASSGDVLIDDLCLVPGAVPENGLNLIAGGDFESALGPNWTVSELDSQTARTTAHKHGGSFSLQVVSTYGGNRLLPSVGYENIALEPGSQYTLSFWYYPSTAGGGLTAGILGGDIEKTVSLVPVSPSSALATPGTANSVRANLPALAPLWINEMMPVNATGPTDRFGDRDAWIELYNAGNQQVALSGIYFTDDPTNLLKSPLPATGTIPAGERLVVWADAEPAESTETEPHLSFQLSPTGGVVTLVQDLSGTLRVLDHLQYPAIAGGRSFGSFPEGDPCARRLFHNPTPGRANSQSASPVRVVINEWMARNRSTLPDPADGDYDDWIELFNPDPVAADLSGYTLTDDLTDPANWSLPIGTTVPPNGFLLVWADNELDQNGLGLGLHAGFRLSQEGDAVGLFAPDGSGIDMVEFGSQQSDVSQGRFPDASQSLIVAMTIPTPGRPNQVPLPPPPVATEISVEGPLVHIAWAVQSGVRYQAQYTDDVGAPLWQPLGEAFLADAPTRIITDVTSGLVWQRFYRLTLQPFE